MQPLLADIINLAELADDFVSLGAAGLMGWMWLWERRTSRAREEQLDAAHARILADGLQIDALLETVRKTSETLTRFSAQQQQLSQQIEKEHP
ncbi:MAG: hypothetical protein AAF743_09665 [Planctomycetota bacterium]